ncbi:hypothetical protein D7Z26_24650 [Cohnella endophytica]|uniref:SLH domain-containing protein n=1 Tax=Cohnella endophytica TaxID=2419778 RepID=A0A494XDS7_9BACL|nr:S-layer homology domain-containing protein [Cohnella endophytica]RKP46274.1 hypothetical protein D7Z26_24650 [Cohnella endophytica]
MKLKSLRIVASITMMLSLFLSPTVSFATTDASQISPAGAHPVKVVSAESFAVALDAEGAVWTWGKNDHNQLGTGDSADRPYPVQVTISGSPKIADIAAGPNYALALDSQGNVWEWGTLSPNPNNISNGTPTLVNGLSGIQQIAAGQTMAMALTADGKVLTWGSNYFPGELGQGTGVSFSLTPSPVVTDENGTVLTGIKQIAKGNLASYALKNDGTVYQWGLINFQRGESTFVAAVVDGVNGATAIASNPNAAFAYAIASGGVFAWGRNSGGQLGTGNTIDSYTPVQVTSLNGKSVKSLSVGGAHVLALMNDGSVWGTGNTSRGQLGDPQIYWQTTAFTKITTVSNVKAAYAGVNNSFFINQDSTVVASGSNYDNNTHMYGQLGVGYNFDVARIPLPMIPLASSYDAGPKPLRNVSIQVVDNDQLKFTYDIPALSNFDKIYFDVIPLGGSAASLSESTFRYDSPYGVTGVTHTLYGHLRPGTYIVKIHTGYTGDHSVSESVTYDYNGAGYTVIPGTVTLSVPVKEWNTSTSTDPSASNSGSVYSAPVAGITVTVTSDNDFSNKMTAVTSTDGVAEFPQLYPGLYHVSIINGISGEIEKSIVKDAVFVFGSRVSHTLQIVSDTQPTDFIYRPDRDTPSGKIGGSFYWYPSSTPSQTQDYRFYFEDGQGNKLGDMIGETPHHTEWTNYYFDVPESETENENDIPAGAIGIRLYTFDGTSEHITPVFASLWNDAMQPLDASMQSTDSTGNNLSGILKWSAATSESGIASYVLMPDFRTIYGNNEHNDLRIAEIPATGAAAYSYDLSDFLLLDNYNSPSYANQYMIGVANAMGQLLGYLNSNHQLVPYAAPVEIKPYSPDSGMGGHAGGGTGGGSQTSPLQQNSDGSLSVIPTTTVTDSGGRKVSQADIASSAILEALDRLSPVGDQVILQIPSDGWDDFELVFEAELFRKLLDRNPNTVLVIQSKFTAFHFPAGTVQKSLEKFGVSLTGAHVKLRMSKKSMANDALLLQLGASSVTTPIDYKMNFIEKNGSDHPLDRFDSYTTHFLTVPSSLSHVSFSHLAGVMVDPLTGKYVPVPAVFTKDSNGNLQARIYGKNNAVYAVVENSKTFPDIETSYAKEAILALSSKFVLNGYEDGSFKPTRTVTRAEFVAMLTRALGVIPDRDNPQGFSDVKANDWFARSVGAAVKAHLISGYSDGSFKPNAEISRAEMFQMIYNAMRSSGLWKETVSPAEIDDILSPYADHGNIPGWAKEAMAVAIKSGMTNGAADGQLAPGMKADRAQSASFLYRMLRNLNLIN